ncbi:hypothetical protein ABZZ79_02935 [Streptomyces sp. NPDC006458]|uniref:hypothetical protein n=1 Tax=Streptomyces sp. NPDC006458 TaxID=3154302 RepID=UPI0033AE5DA8
MTDHPYSDDDLRAAAAKYTGEGWDSLAIRDDMDENEPWNSLDADQRKTAWRKIVDLATKAPDLSHWAVALGADGLQPDGHTIHLGIDPGNGDQPRVRLHFAFAPNTSDADRDHFVLTLSKRILNSL